MRIGIISILVATLALTAFSGLIPQRVSAGEEIAAPTSGAPAAKPKVKKWNPAESAAMFTANNTWMLTAAFLVFLMHLGFACLESGLTRAKNTVNILCKNTCVVAIGLLTYTLAGFNLMYPGFAEGSMKFFGFSGWWIGPPYDTSNVIASMGYAGAGYTYWTDFIFQAMFAATAATIVSGAVAERVKLSSFLVFTTIYVGVVYPIVGSWKWGLGWLNTEGFYDFAGSTLVHSVGGWAALAGIIVLGPRIGKYVNGQVKPIMGHSLPLAAIGVFLLWLGWYGFNGGSVLSANPETVSLVFVTTTLGAAAGVMTALMTSWIIQKQPDLTMVLNGALAGLVGITASANVISPKAAVIIGGIAGILVVLSVIGLDKLKLDDPVGAVSVHLVCGIWGTLAAGIFGKGQSVIAQLIGIAAYGVACFGSSLVIFYIIKATMGMRVTADEEKRGLDISEHGQEAYAGFQIFSTQ